MDRELEAGQLHVELFNEIDDLISPGESIYTIVDYINEFLYEKGAFDIPDARKVTININNVIYHGVPGDVELKEGDVLTVDICFIYKGVLIDGAKTYTVGNCSEVIEKLIKVSKESVKEVLSILKAGISVVNVLKFLNDYVLLRGYYLFKEGVGHGVGSSLHQSPFLSLSDFSDSNYIFKPGDKFTIEPIIMLYEDEVYENIIGEGIISENNLSSQFEVTIIIDQTGKPIVLNDALLK